MPSSFMAMCMSRRMIRRIHRCSDAVVSWCSADSTAIFFSSPGSFASASSCALSWPTVSLPTVRLQRSLMTVCTTSGKLPCSLRWYPADGFFQLSIFCASSDVSGSASSLTYIFESDLCLTR